MSRGKLSGRPTSLLYSGAVLLRVRQPDVYTTLTIQLQSHSTVHGIERHLPLLILQSNIVESTAYDPVRLRCKDIALSLERKQINRLFFSFLALLGSILQYRWLRRSVDYDRL